MTPSCFQNPALSCYFGHRKWSAPSVSKTLDCGKIPSLGRTLTLQTALTSHSHVFVWHKWGAGSWKANNFCESFQFHPNSLKMLTCYVPSRSKTSFSKPDPQGGKSQISRRRRRRLRRRTSSRIQIQAPHNAPRDEVLRKGNPRCWSNTRYICESWSKFNDHIAEKVSSKRTH